MQFQIEQRKLDLAQRLQAALEIFSRHHFVEQRFGQRRAGLGVARHRAQHLPFIAEVLHELAGQFDCVPFHAMYAGNTKVLHLRQQMMQTVAKLVEQRDHFIVGELCGLPTHRC